MKPVVVILAAGESRRLGQPKALARIAGRTVLERLCAESRAAGAIEIAIVAGAHAAEIFAARASFGERVTVLLHSAWAEGRTGSIAAAAAALPRRDLLLAPVDVPLVDRRTFRRLFERWSELGAPSRGWLAPCHGNPPRFGHPLILGADLAAESRRMAPDEPLRSLRAGSQPLAGIAVDDPAILDDLDSPADLAALDARARP